MLDGFAIARRTTVVQEKGRKKTKILAHPLPLVWLEFFCDTVCLSCTRPRTTRLFGDGRFSETVRRADESERSQTVRSERGRIGGDGKTGRENVSMASERPEKRRSMDAVHAGVRARTL